MTSRNYIVAAVVIALLMWGNVDHGSSWWWVKRLGYVVLVPLGVWWLLNVIWRRWMPDEVIEDRLRRGIEGVLSGVFLAWSITRMEHGVREQLDALSIMLPISGLFFYLSTSRDNPHNRKDD